ncbi:peptidase M50B-like-domain-containing protein [Hygrophoropsis aurantiaca]|uniref:Peptidase M50B-like-domain-containing protein n=1 Tax=Hygrophoropsis aurantiaca TaxID=72124 RepID=A0ACB8A1P7_9AGAM|nr:peptidase M50B-like-domain-containing protein [Hygrophoropsis aurantiaca]
MSRTLAPPAPHIDPLTPAFDQVVVLYVTVVYAVVIFGIWNIPGVRTLINPLKLFTIGWHEFCHIVGAVLTGGTIISVTIDPNLGGATVVEGGYPPAILSAGYIGSTIFGGVFILGGFDSLVAKILSFVLGLGLITPLVLVRDKLTILLTLVYEGLLVGFWFVGHAQALRWYCLFIGIMNVFYVVWDLADDKFFRKANDSDCTQFYILYPRISAHLWAILWILFEIGVCISFIFLGLAAFKISPQDMNTQAGNFLPT